MVLSQNLRAVVERINGARSTQASVWPIDLLKTVFPSFNSNSRSTSIGSLKLTRISTYPSYIILSAFSVGYYVVMMPDFSKLFLVLLCSEKIMVKVTPREFWHLNFWHYRPIITPMYLHLFGRTLLTLEKFYIRYVDAIILCQKFRGFNVSYLGVPTEK